MAARNALNAFQAEEIDVAFWNEGDPTGLRMFARPGDRQAYVWD